MNCNWILIASMALLAGCTQALKSTDNAEGDQGVFKLASGHDTSEVEYVIDPPDEIQVKASNIKEIDGVKQEVRTDGRISLNLLGEIQASGKTPAQLTKDLRDIAAKYYVNPDVKVEVIAKSKFYQIFGRGVNQQGKKPYTGNDTVIKALAEAGLSEHAWPQQVWVVRPAKNGRAPARAVVDFNHMAQTGDMTQNYVLQQDDIVTVPDSPLASFNFKFTQIAGPITGASDGAGSVRGATGH